ncbi:MAG: PadR family transcriptional regulator [Pseudomonadota bacterium]
MEWSFRKTSRNANEFSGYDLSKRLGIASGTLYPLLAKLKQAKMVEDRWEENLDPKEAGRPRRRYYKISGLGAQAVSEKMRQLDAGYERRSPVGVPIPNGGVTS